MKVVIVGTVFGNKTVHGPFDNDECMDQWIALHVAGQPYEIIPLLTHGISGYDHKAMRAAIDEICRHEPCPHDAVDTGLGDGKIWAKCYDRGETILQESLDASREEYKRFDTAIRVLSQF